MLGQTVVRLGKHLLAVSLCIGYSIAASLQTAEMRRRVATRTKPLTNIRSHNSKDDLTGCHDAADKTFINSAAFL